MRRMNRRPRSAFVLVFIIGLLFWNLRAFAQAQAAPAPAPVNPQAKTQDASELVKQGEKLAGEGKPDEAMALYQQAVDLNPDLYQAQLFLGVALDLQGKYTDARQHL